MIENLLAAIFFSLDQIQSHGAAKEVGKEVVWLWHLLCEFGCEKSLATTLYCDNQSAIQVAHNPIFHAKIKHIEIDVHYIRDLVQENIVNLQFCPSEDRTTNIFTKSMLEAKFLKLRSMLGMIEVNIKGG